MVTKTKKWIIEIDWDDFNESEPIVDLAAVREPWNNLNINMIGFRITIEK